jgi:RNA polymerase sigma-70 factor (ECF subfamily)
MMDESDNSLVEKVLDGETEIFRTLIDRHKSRIYYLGLRFFHNNEDAEDFAQDVFLKAFNNLYSFKGEVPFGAWLYKLAFNAAVNKYEFDKLRLTDIAEPVEQIAYEHEEYSAPERETMNSELREKINDALALLPDTYKIVIRMHFFDSLTYAEISDITDIPVNTIKSHVSRAKKLIRDVLSPYVSLSDPDTDN